MQGSHDKTFSGNEFNKIIVEATNGIFDRMLEDHRDPNFDFQKKVKQDLETIDQKLTSDEQLKLRKKLLLPFHPDRQAHLQDQYMSYTVRTHKSYDKKHYEHCVELLSQINPILTHKDDNDDNKVKSAHEDTHNQVALTPNHWQWRMELLKMRISKLKATIDAYQQVLNSMPKPEALSPNDHDAVQDLEESRKALNDLIKSIENKFEELNATQEVLYHHSAASFLQKIIHDADKDIQQYWFIIRVILGICVALEYLVIVALNIPLCFIALKLDSIQIACTELLSQVIDLSSFFQDIAKDSLKREQKWCDAQKEHMKFIYLNKHAHPQDIFYDERHATVSAMYDVKTNLSEKGVDSTIAQEIIELLGGIPTYFDYTFFDGELSIKNRGKYQNQTLYHYHSENNETPISIDICFKKVDTIADFQNFKNSLSSPYYASYVQVKEEPSKLYYFSKRTYQHQTPHAADLRTGTNNISDVHFTFDIKEINDLDALNLQEDTPLSVEAITKLETLTGCPEIQDKEPIQLLAELRQKLLVSVDDTTEQSDLINEYLVHILEHRQCEQYYLESYSKNNIFKHRELSMNAWWYLYLLCTHSARAMANAFIKNPMMGTAQAFATVPILILYTLAFLLNEIIELLFFMKHHGTLLIEAVVHSVVAAPIKIARMGYSFFHKEEKEKAMNEDGHLKTPGNKAPVDNNSNRLSIENESP